LVVTSRHGMGGGLVVEVTVEVVRTSAAMVWLGCGALALLSGGCCLSA